MFSFHSKPRKKERKKARATLMRFPLDASDNVRCFCLFCGEEKLFHSKWKLSTLNKSFSIYFQPNFLVPFTYFHSILHPPLPTLLRSFLSHSPLKYVFDSLLDCCNYQQRNLIKKIYAIKLCVIFESLLFPLAKKCCAMMGADVAGGEGAWFVSPITSPLL